MRQAFAGMVWSQQFYHYDVARWLEGDECRAARGAQRRAQLRLEAPRQSRHHRDAGQVGISLVRGLGPRLPLRRPRPYRPGGGEAPAAAACREWYMHPNGQLPAYEWNFGDVNPPVHAWAALTVFRIDGGKDFDFLARAFHKLLINFTWWVNRKDALGNNIFEGGFLGLDNIGPFDRSAAAGGRSARAVGRHRLDGEVLSQHAGDGAPARQSRSGL